MAFSKILRSIALLLLATAALSGVVDRASDDFAREGLNRALATFAVARALNGVVSVARGTEVALEPGGVGVTLAPGQVLDPIHDLIERFSGVMLIAASSLGLQMILLSITSWWGVTALLLAALLLWLVSIWLPRLNDNKFFYLGSRLALALVFLRFAIPFVIICTNLLFGAFLEREQDSLTNDLTATSLAIDAINTQLEEAAGPLEDDRDDAAAAEGPEPATSASTSVWDSIANIGAQIRESTREWSAAFSEWYESFNLANKIAEIQERAAASIESIVRLIAIFVLQTVLFPIGFLWLFVELLKSAARQSLAVIESRGA